MFRADLVTIFSYIQSNERWLSLFLRLSSSGSEEVCIQRRERRICQVSKVGAVEHITTLIDVRVPVWSEQWNLRGTNRIQDWRFTSGDTAKNWDHNVQYYMACVAHWYTCDCCMHPHWSFFTQTLAIRFLKVVKVRWSINDNKRKISVYKQCCFDLL